MDKRFVIVGFLFIIAGMLLGIFMAASKNHAQYVTHTHIMLVGFLLSFAYGLCHKVWIKNRTDWMAQLQFYLHVIGAIMMTVGLFLLYGGFVAPPAIEPVLSVGSLAVLLAALLILALFLKTPKSIDATA